MTDAILKGKEAQYLLNNALLNETLDALERHAIEGIRTCAASDLIEYRARLDGIDHFRRSLQAYLDNAMLAAKTLEINS